MRRISFKRLMAMLLSASLLLSCQGVSALAEGFETCTHGSTYIRVEAGVPATCTADGSHTVVLECADCGVELSRNTVTDAATGHDYRETARSEPGVGTEGSVTYTCSRCEDVDVKTLPALPAPAEDEMPEEALIPEEEPIPEEPADAATSANPAQPEDPVTPEKPAQPEEAVPEAGGDPQTADDPTQGETYPVSISFVGLDLSNSSYDYIGIGDVEVAVGSTVIGTANFAAGTPVDFPFAAGTSVWITCLPNRSRDVYIKSFHYESADGSESTTYVEGDGFDEVGYFNFTMPACAASVMVEFDIHKYAVDTVIDSGKYYYANDIDNYSRTGDYVNVAVGTWEGYAVTGVEYSWVSGGETVTEQAARNDIAGIREPVYRFVMPAGNVTIRPIVMPKHAVTAAQADHGIVIVSPSMAAAGETVTVTGEADEDYRLGYVYYTPDEGTRTRVRPDADGHYTFAMPDADVIVEAEFRYANAWQLLQDQIDNAADGDTVIVSDDITATAENYELTFGLSKNVTLDLNGHTLSRGVQDASYKGYVIYVMTGTVTITDSRGGGVITGGKGTYNGGGICVIGGSLTLAGGSVSGNTAEKGGGVFVDGGSFTLSGGAISGNTATASGGGVFVNSGTFTLAGGSLANNNGTDAGGGAHVYGGSLVITGGTVSGNTASLGEGIYPDAGVSVSVANGSVISVTDELCLNSGTSVAVTGIPAEGSQITVYLQDRATREQPAVIATAPSNCASVFTVKNQQDNTEVAWDNGRRAVVLQMTTAVLTWAELQTALGEGGEWEYAEPEDIYIVRLGADITAGSGDSALTFRYNTHPVRLDLCGHSINRGLTAGAENGNVLTVLQGELILCDSVGGGRITGGYNLDNSGSGVVIDDGTFTMEGGSITGNAVKDVNGAGVYLNSGTFHMKGGSITGNQAIDCEGGGVYVRGGTFKVSGSPSVTGNTAGTKASDVYLNTGSVITLGGKLTGSASVSVGAAYTGRFTDDSWLTYHQGDDPRSFFTADGFHILYVDAEGYPCIESRNHTAADEPVWDWTGTPLPTATMHCRNCGEVIWTEEGAVGEPVWNNDRGVFVFTASAEKDGETYTTDISQMPVTVDRAEPSVDAEGRYVPGVAEHFRLTWNGQTHYYTRSAENFTVLDERALSDLTLFWFDFDGQYIVRYTGPIVQGTQNSVDLPKYAPEGSTPLTCIGDGDHLFVSTYGLSEDTGLCFTDRGNITMIHSFAFTSDRNVTLTLNTENMLQVASAAFTSCSGMVIRCKHASKLGWGAYNDTTGVYTVDYLDPHTLLAVSAAFEDDYSAARLTIRCSEEYCGLETTLDAEVTVEEDPDTPGSFLAKATAVYEDKEYSITKPVATLVAAFTVSIGTTAERFTFRIPKAVGKDYAVFRPDDLNIPDFGVPDGADFAGWKTGDTIYDPGDRITVTADTTEFTAAWTSTWTAVREALLEQDACVYLYNNIEAGPEDLPLVVPAGSEAVLILRGFDVDRHLSAAAADGYAIRVDGTLHINSNPAMSEAYSGGTVKGGNTTGSGGGILVKGTLDARSVAVSGNKAGGNGGAICVATGATAKLSSVTADNNQAVNGGAVFVSRDGNLEMSSCGLHRNSASKDGGGLYTSDGATAKLNSGEIKYCSAVQKGGGVYVGGDVEVTIDDNTQPDPNPDQQSSSGSSGGLRVVITGFVIAACTVAFCVAGVGGGIYFNKGSMNLGPGTEIIDNVNPSNTFDNLDGNPSNDLEFRIPEVDPSMPIKIGIPLTAAAAAGGGAGGMALWLKGLLAAGAVAAAGATIGIIYYYTRDKKDDNDRQSNDCSHPQWKTTGLHWEEDKYSYVGEFLDCTNCDAHRYNTLTPTVTVNSNDETVYTVTQSDGSGTTDKRIVAPFELQMISNLFGDEMAAIRLRFPHNRGADYTHPLPSASPWSFSPTCIEFTGWKLGDDAISDVSYRDKEDDGRTKTVVANWKVSITYSSGALIEGATIAGHAPQDPNPSMVPIGSVHDLLPCTWEQFVTILDGDGDEVKVAYVFDGWDVSVGVRFIDGITPDYIFETASGAPGKQPGTPIGPIALPTMVKARWRSPWKIMGDALNKNGHYQLNENTYAVQLDSGITIKKDAVLNLNGHKAHAHMLSLVRGVFAVDSGISFRVTDDSSGKKGRISGGKATSSGGGVNVAGGATLTLEAGSIMDNTCLNPMVTQDEALIPANGGGVNVEGTFIMKGGSVKDNKASSSGGGVYVKNGATFRMTGGEIKDNTARYLREDESFLGGGVYVGGTFEVAGKIVIQDNKQYVAGDGPNKDSNVYLPDGKKITVIGKLSEDTRIGVSMAAAGVITSGLKGNSGDNAWGSAGNFISDDDAYMVIINADGEAELVAKRKVTFEKGDENAQDKDSEGKPLMPDAEVGNGRDYELPECKFGEPEGKKFKEWSVKIGEAEAVAKPEKASITVTADTVVTAVWEEETPVFKGHAILLTGQIGLQFFLELPEGKTAADYEGGYVTFEGNKADSTKQYPIPESTAVISGTDTGRYLFVINLSSIQMADKFTPTFHWKVNDEEKTVKGDAYAAEDYIKWGLTGTSGRELAIVRALADYGYYAQPYLAAQNGWTVGEDYAAMTTHVTDAYVWDTVKEQAGTDVAEKHVSEAVPTITYRLQFASTISLRVNLTPARGVSLTTVTVDGREVTPVKSGKLCYVTIRDINATALTATHTVSAEGASITLSPMSYVYALLDSETASDEAKNAVCALYCYAKACQQE